MDGLCKEPGLAPAYLKIWFKRNADVGYIKIWGLMNVHLEVPKLIGVESHFSIQVVTVLSVASRHVTVTCLCMC